MDRCECHQLSFAALRSLIRRRGIRTVEELMAVTAAGTNCGTCKPHLEQLFAAAENPGEPDPPEIPRRRSGAQYTDLRELFGDAEG